MKNYFLSCIMVSSLVVVGGCMHHTDEDVVGSACQTHRILSIRYQDLMEAQDEAAIVEKSRLLSMDTTLSFGSAVWQSMIGNEHLAFSNGAPLHRALYFIESDIRVLEGHAHKLGRRLLDSNPIYGQLDTLRQRLCLAARIIKSQKSYVDEAQFVEEQRVAKSTLYESKKQTALLQDIAEKPTYVEYVERVEHPVYVVKEVERVVERPVCVVKRVERIVEKPIHKKKPSKKQIKKVLYTIK
jgi:hypothetical protein